MNDFLGLAYFGAGGWAKQLLTQLGVCFVDSRQMSSSNEPRVLFCSESGKELDALLRGSSTLRVVVTTHPVAIRQFGLSATRRQAKWFVADTSGARFRSHQLVYALDVPEPFTESGAHLSADGVVIPGSGVVAFKHGQILVLSLPWNLGEDTHYASHSDYWTVAYRPGRRFTELAPAIDPVAVRSVLQECLRFAFGTQGLPYVYVSSKPKSGPYLGFRIDADGYSKESTDACVRIAERTGIRFSWFIDVRPWIRHLGQTRGFVASRHEVGIHCFYHVTYQSTISNLLNLALAKWLLRTVGISVSSVVSPYGLTTPGYRRAVSRLKFSNTSEFSMSGDDLPFAIGSEGELQVPCSNLSVGVLPEEHRRDVFELWSDSIRNQVSDKGVAIIYDHPLGRMETLEDEIVRFLQDQLGSGLNPITMAEYGSLWRTRPQIRHVSRTANEISYELEGDESVFLVLIMPPPDIETLDVGRSLVMSSTGGFDYFRDDDRSKALSEVSRRSFLRSLVRDIAKISVHAVRPLKRRHLVHSDGLGTGRMPD